ncbi:ferritin-like domain-containing protein [Leptospira brenneri]|uniref:ferritin-like domain-containing protein n=1 Tax=Leptospira brenneri TaxID=2023182 RepID=UPI000C29BA5C|nr:ferritin family protein [Leptospira brenneri]PJZ43899.1 rubrerythrin [Leptospira brenneri]
MKSLKKTSFIEAVAAAIEHEVQCFNFYLKLSESLPEGQIRELFSQLALDGDEHIKFIKEIYKGAEGKELPNLKQLSEIEKFHSSTIQKVMDRLDRNKNEEVKADERKALELAIREGEDARNFYATIRNKFQDPKINLLFQKLANFNESNNSLLEAQALAMEQSTPADQVFYWEDEELMEQVNSSPRSSGKAKVSKPAPKPKASSAKPSAKKTAKPANKSLAKKTVKKAIKKPVKKAAPKPKAKTKPAKKKGKKK